MSVGKGRLRALLAAGVAVSALLSISGCNFMVKARAGRLLTHAPMRLADEGTVAITLTVASAASTAAAQAGVTVDPGIELTGVLDLRHDRATYKLAGATSPYVIFDGLQFYGRLPSAVKNDARPWVAFDAATVGPGQHLDPGATPASLGLLALPPSLLVDLMGGSLSGSVKPLEPQQVGGATETAYRANVDISKALSEAVRRHYSQHQQNQLGRLLKAVNVSTGSMQRGETWLDPAGVPRRFQLTLVEHPQPHVTQHVILDMRFAATRELPSPPPTPDELVTVPSLFQYLTAMRPPSAAQPGGAA